MSSSSNSSEPTRPIPMPVVDEGRNMHAVTTLSPKQNTTRARVPIPPEKVMPVIVVPGIMGSNLRASANGGNTALKKNEPAWRPPNANSDAIQEIRKWKSRDPAKRQRVLDPDTLEVDPTGEIIVPPSTTEFVWDGDTAVSRGWGEIHSGSYGQLLAFLQMSLNVTFKPLWGKPLLAEHWSYLNKFNRANWGTTKSGVAAELTNDEMKKFAEFHYPVYAFGYNWLQCNSVSANKLGARIDEIISFWKAAQFKCDSVILVSHSMGGLVSRACAKNMPEKIAGIIHGVMPALGAPACYRRLACGTEDNSPTNSMVDNFLAGGFAAIAGKDESETTPVLAVAPGPLELLPNHLYPKPWLFLELMPKTKQRSTVVELSFENPYNFYRNFRSWYRAIDLALVDPAGKLGKEVETTVSMAIGKAERFHMETLGSYYHPQTFAFYGADVAHASFGTCRWRSTTGGTGFSTGEVESGALVRKEHANADERTVVFYDGSYFDFRHSVQDVAGDGTVPWQSGMDPDGKVLQTFRTVGFDHQGSYKSEAMNSLTLHLIVKLMQKK